MVDEMGLRLASQKNNSNFRRRLNGGGARGGGGERGGRGRGRGSCTVCSEV